MNKKKKAMEEVKKDEETERKPRKWLPYAAGLLGFCLICSVAAYFVYTRLPGINPRNPISVVPQPTFTPPPSATLSNILIEDDFKDAQVSDAWTKVEGDLLFIEGGMTSNGPIKLEAGDSSWTNYKVEFEATAAGSGASITLLTSKR